MPPQAAKKAAKKAAKTAPAFVPEIGQVVVFEAYEAENTDPILVTGDYAEVVNIDATTKGRQRFHLKPLTGENTHRVETAFAEEFRKPTDQEAEEAEAFRQEPEDDTIQLGIAADQGDQEAAARLTEIATASGFDPEAYETWEALGEALVIPETEDPDAEAEGIDWDTLGANADAGDADAAAELTAYCEQAGVDPNSKPTWVEIAGELAALATPEPEAEPEPEPAPAAKKGAKKAANAAPATPVPAAKKAAKKGAQTAPAAGGAKKPKLVLTESIERVLAENDNDLLAAMQSTEAQIGQSFIDLGGLIKWGEVNKLHLTVLDPATGKPMYEDSSAGYYKWVADNLEQEERAARHLAKIYHIFVAKLKYDPESIAPLGVSRLREVAGVAMKLAKDDTANQTKLLEELLQQVSALSVKDTVAKVRALKHAGAGDGTGEGTADALAAKVTLVTFRMLEERSIFVKAVLDDVKSGLPEAQQTADEALFELCSKYATEKGLPGFAPAKKATAAKKAATKTATKQAQPAPAAKKAAKKAARVA